MKRHLRILIIEDSHLDRELILHELRRGGYGVDCTHVLNRREMLERIDEHDWDIILSDFNIPGFGGLEALSIAKERKPDVPFIIVSGQIGEETAVEAMKKGMADYVYKDRLSKLVPVVEREIQEAQNRRARKQAESERSILSRELEAERAKLELIFEHVPAFICDLRLPDFTIGLSNPAFTALFEGKNIKGRRLEDVISREANRPVFESIEHVYKTGIPFVADEMEVRLGESGERTLHVKVLHQPLFDASGALASIFVHGIDVSSQVAARKELERAKEAAESANKLKTAFLANMSHEIRTPLGAIIGYADLVKDSKSTPEEKQAYLDVIERNGQALYRLIGDVLDLSKIEAGRIDVEVAEFDLIDLVDDVIVSLEPQARAKGLGLNREFSAGLPRLICSDAYRIRQILTNLLGNAIKFTETGSVTLKARADRLENGRVRLEFEIIDTGVGIPADKVSNLFRPFSQLDDSMSRKFGGTGLGLHLSKRLAESLGGDIELVGTALGKGSLFRVTLSVEESGRTDQRLARVPNGRSGEGDLAGTRILLVEDSPDNQVLITRYLSKVGASIDVASDGKQAIEKALMHEFDVILMDIQLPIVDGYTASATIRSAGKKTPIIALTAHALKEDKEKCLSSGANFYLTKPVKAPELIGAIKRHLAPAPQAPRSGEDLLTAQ